MGHSDVRDRILKRIDELGGKWPENNKELAREIGCHPSSVKEAKRWVESERISGLKNPCDYCGKFEKVVSTGHGGCDECSDFLLSCHLLAEITRSLMMNQPVTGIDEGHIRRAKLALAAIVGEWVVRRNEIAVCGDPQIEPESRSANRWFYEQDNGGDEDENFCSRCHVEAAEWLCVEVYGDTFVCDRCKRAVEGTYERIGQTGDGD